MQVIAHLFMPEKFSLESLKTAESASLEFSRLFTYYHHDIRKLDEEMVKVMEKLKEEVAKPKNCERSTLFKNAYASWIQTTIQTSFKEAFDQASPNLQMLAVAYRHQVSCLRVSQEIAEKFFHEKQTNLAKMEKEEWKSLLETFVQAFGKIHTTPLFLEYLKAHDKQIPKCTWEKVLPSLLNFLDLSECQQYRYTLKNLLEASNPNLLLDLFKVEMAQPLSTILRESRLCTELLKVYLSYNPAASHWLNFVVLRVLFKKLSIEEGVKTILDHLCRSLSKNEDALCIKDHFPPMLLKVLRYVQTQAVTRLADEQEKMEGADTRSYQRLHLSLLFLTCLNPAIISPQHFNLRASEKDACLLSTRVQITKQLQGFCTGDHQIATSPFLKKVVRTTSYYFEGSNTIEEKAPQTDGKKEEPPPLSLQASNRTHSSPAILRSSKDTDFSASYQKNDEKDYYNFLKSQISVHQRGVAQNERMAKEKSNETYFTEFVGLLEEEMAKISLDPSVSV